MIHREGYTVSERMVTYHNEISDECTVIVYMTKGFVQDADHGEVADYLERCVEDAARRERIRTDAY